ncbi:MULTISPECIES: RNA polymerase sigma factor [unclassified Cryobacterium]|uniref:RNA polymerase sigma factor n=1 Tax=unclassified Cryobacterium TaxID=2649013 RepID=UPI001447787B|nr:MULTISPECIES: sigma-70 family RNA polymerase sigma factor [unclassified Cryobacterium]
MFSEVLTAAQAGGQWANRIIWTEYSPKVAAYLRARGSLEPDDLTSEVFLTVFAQLADFEGDEEQFRAFVFTIAHRRLVDELRKRSSRGLHVEWSEESDARATSSAESQAMERIGNDDARALLDGLPPDQRDVLVLRIIADLTVEQIAELLGKRPGAVKALQRRGLERLRKKVGATRTLFADSNDSKV